MKKKRADSYEAQLTPDELQNLHSALLQSDARFPQVQAAAVPWRSGPFTGMQPSIRTLGNIASRLRVENLTAEISSTSRAMRATTTKMEGDPAMGVDPNLLMKKICVLLAQEVLEKTVKREDPRSRACLITLLQRQQRFMLEQKKFQKLTTELLSDWYWKGPGKKIIDAQFARNRGQLIEKLGRIIFGDTWDPPKTPKYSRNHPSAPEFDADLCGPQPTNPSAQPPQPPASNEPKPPQPPPSDESQKES